MSPPPARRVALCVARFYAELADKLEAGARQALDEAGVVDVDRFEVPGAFELPLVASYAARSGGFDAVVCLGAVIRGETDHYDHVCREAARGIQQVQLETGVPCGFGVLTVDTMAQALDRVAGGSKRDTGRAAAEAALASVAVKDALGRDPVAPGRDPPALGRDPAALGRDPVALGRDPVDHERSGVR